MSDDDSSDLSSAPSDIEEELRQEKNNGILKFFSKVPKSSKPAVPRVATASPPPPQREPSPPHEYVLADNPDIAFVVMFRSRFTDAFPKSLANFGPQELERGVVESSPAEHVEHLLCALLGLLLNRKQDVKNGHYNRALEEAVQTHKSQWARDWEDKNPLAGNATFQTMTPTERETLLTVAKLTLLRTLILWTLSSSQVVRDIIAASYKQNRHEDDLNQPLSVPPWGSDSYRKRYYLIEGLDDTNFRIYREGGGVKERTWWSVAGEIEELKSLAEKLSVADGGQKARILAAKMRNAIPRFEATEEKRRRREYRQARKQQFKRPEPGFSMYEGRTRGKRMKYTYSDEEDEIYSDSTNRRSERNTGVSTPAESGQTVTLSGRQVRSRMGGVYGESILSGAGLDTPGEQTGDDSEDVGRRPRRAKVAGSKGQSNGSRLGDGYNSLDDDESDASEQDYGDDEEEEEHVPVESEEEEADELSDVEEDPMDLDDTDKKSLLIKLPLKTPTPERKSTSLLGLSGEGLSDNGSAEETKRNIASTETDQESPAVTDTPATVPQEDQGDEANTTTDEAIPGSVTLPAAPAILQDIPLPQSKPVEPESPKVNQATSPSHSPSLTFRGSPQKTDAFPPRVDVGSNI